MTVDPVVVDDVSVGSNIVESRPPKRFVVMRRLFRARRSKVLGFTLLAIVLVGVAGPLLVAADPNRQDMVNRFAMPEFPQHPLGTDQLGRDILARLVYGARLTLGASFLAISVAVVAGVPAGLVAGYTKGAFAHISGALADVLLSLPAIILAMAIVGIRGPGVTNVMLAIGIVLAPRFYRVAKSAAETASAMTFIEASRAIGSPTRRILTRNLLMNSIAPIMVQLTFSLSLAIVAEASLSFLGLGAQSPSTSLGTMVKEGFAGAREEVWPILPPSILIAAIVYVVSSLGDSLQDAVARGTR